MKQVARFDYNESLYSSKTLRYFAREYLKVLPEDVEGLLSIGSSGNSIASAMLALAKRGRRLVHCQVRKPKEESHHNDFVGYYGTGIKYAIVDDFISTGTTIDHLLLWAKGKHMNISCIIVYQIKRPALEMKLDFGTAKLIKVYNGVTPF